MNDLHRDVLTEGLPEFEQSVLKVTVSAAQRTRRLRNAVRSGVALAAMVGAILLWFPRTENPDLASRPPIRNSSPGAAPQPTHQWITIRTERFNGVLRTKPLPPGKRLLSTSGRIAVVHTSNFKPEIREINDEQLLSFFEGQAVALVGRGPNATLVFPEDAESQ